MSVLPEVVLDTILSEVLGRPQSFRDLGELCDRVGGRIAGTDAGRKAEDWALAALARHGLPQIWTDPLDLAVWERGSLDVVVQGAGGWQPTAVAHANSPLKVDLEAAIIDVGHGRATDFADRGANLGALSPSATKRCLPASGIPIAANASQQPSRMARAPCSS